MSTFLRLQLQNSERDDYPPLWEALLKRGFQKTIVAEDGTRYRLPNGTYLIEGTTRQQAYSLAREATTEAKVEGRFLIVEGNASMAQLEQQGTLAELLEAALASKS